MFSDYFPSYYVFCLHTNYDIDYTFMPFMLTYANEASVQHNIINYNILYFRRAIKWNFVQYSQHVLYCTSYRTIYLSQLTSTVYS